MASFSKPDSQPPKAGKPSEDWQSTRAQTALATQFLEEEEDYLAPDPHDIGRQTSANERELFVSCEPALAMRLQFEHLQPRYIAIHDIATASSRKLLGGIAAASSRVIQKLLIRRQGQGTTLATIEFVELPSPDGPPLRIYSTEVDADTTARHGLARMLLAFSRLGVIMVGDLPGHAIASSLKPFHEFMITGPWPNRQILLLPLAAGSTLGAQGTELARGTEVVVRTAPQVTRPADAWGFINGTWNRLREPARAPAAAAAPSRPGAAGAATRPGAGPATTTTTTTTTATATGSAASPRAPGLQGVPGVPGDMLTLRPMPVVVPAGSRPAEPKSVLDRYVQQVCELPGVVSCCVFDVTTGMELTHAGASPSAADLAAHGKSLLAAMGATSAALGLGRVLPDAAITLGSLHLLLRAVPRHPGLALHAALDKTHANLTLARLQIQRMDAIFDPPANS